MGSLTVTLFGKRLRNPVMNASGTLGYGREIECLWPLNTLGAYLTKGLSLNAHHGNPTPRVWEERGGMINSIGLQNIGLERFFRDHFPVFAARKTPIIVNFFGFTEEEYIACAGAIRPHPLIVALEMNLSCPNVKEGGISFGKEPSMVARIVERVKKTTPIPVIAKLTPEVKNIAEIARAAHEGGADGLTLINTMPAAVVDVKRRSLPLKGGLSGPALRPIALRAVLEVRKSVPIPIIGAGGIMDETDALAFLMAGATAVQIGTATFVEPFTIPRVVEGLQRYVDESRCGRIEKLIAAAHG
jgi:dihydroorotate dehydrogenase (NAD+) catalytic subunit